MIDWRFVAIITSIVGLQVGFIYWLFRTFVSEKTCKARNDCLEGKIDNLHNLVKAEFKHVKQLFENLIEGKWKN